MREKRKFIRLAAPIGIVYRPVSKLKNGQKDCLSLIKNISGGGVSFDTKEVFRIGDLLQIEIQIPHLKDPVRAVAEVVRVGEKSVVAGRELGLSFRDIEPKELNKILDYVYTIGIGHE